MAARQATERVKCELEINSDTGLGHNSERGKVEFMVDFTLSDLFGRLEMTEISAKSHFVVRFINLLVSLLIHKNTLRFNHTGILAL